MSVVLQLQFRIKLSNNQLNNQLNSKLFNPKLNKLNHKLNPNKMETMELLEEQSKFSVEQIDLLKFRKFLG